METPHAVCGRAGSRPSQPRTFAVAIAGWDAGVGQGGVRPCSFTGGNHCMKPELFVTLTMVKLEKIGQSPLPSGGCMARTNKKPTPEKRGLYRARLAGTGIAGTVAANWLLRPMPANAGYSRCALRPDACQQWTTPDPSQREQASVPTPWQEGHLTGSGFSPGVMLTIASLFSFATFPVPLHL